MPVLRYRTRDLAALDRSPCPCGRTGARMSRVIGRSDDMLIIRGVNLFPTQIEELICGMPKLAPHYLLEVDKQGHMDTLTVKVEVNPEADVGRHPEQKEALAKALTQRIKGLIGLSVKVMVGEPFSIERVTIGKARRVIDRRPKA
jgi:phenylacetate-CoA ligase